MGSAPEGERRSLKNKNGEEESVSDPSHTIAAITFACLLAAAALLAAVIPIAVSGNLAPPPLPKSVPNSVGAQPQPELNADPVQSSLDAETDPPESSRSTITALMASANEPLRTVNHAALAAARRNCMLPCYTPQCLAKRSLCLLDLFDQFGNYDGIRQRIEVVLNTLESDPDTYFQPVVYDSWRPLGVQAQLCASSNGLTSTLCSQHIVGRAVDIIDATNWWNDMSFFRQLGSVATEHGFEWGGDWRERDYAHIQYKPLPEEAFFSTQGKQSCICN